MIFIEYKQLFVAKNGLSFHSSVFYQATLEDSQLRGEADSKRLSPP
jgi:hypothetical protein